MTSILLIVVLVLLVVCPLLLKNKKGPRNAVVAVLLLAAVGLVIANTKQQAAPKADPGAATYLIHETVMTRMGNLLADDLPAGGTVIVVQQAEASPGIRKNNAAEFAGLQGGIGSAPIEYIVVQPSSGMGQFGAPMDMSLPPAELTKALADHADAAALVCCTEVPIENLGSENLPPIYVFDRMRSLYWQDAMAAGKVEAAIVPRETMAELRPAQLKDDPGGVFEASFEIKRGAGS